MQGGSRFSQRMSYGYWLRVWHKGRHVYQESFSAGKYGGFRAALRAAKARRAEICSQHGISLEVSSPQLCSRISRTPWDEPGIELTLWCSWAGLYYASWRAFWPCGRRPGTQTRSINAHGYACAWEVAVRARREMTGQAIEPLPPPPPRRMIRQYLRRRLGDNWRSLIVPPWESWWR